jgi:hypothetical protein
MKRGVIIMKREGVEKEREELLVDLVEDLAGGSADPVKESLLDTAHTISSVVQPRQPSRDFVNRVSNAVQEKFQEQVSMEKIQRVIGMAVTLEDFRKALFDDVAAACRSVGFSLNANEMAALKNLREDAVKEFANSLDERITKFFPTNLP